jgi:chromosome segregation ATPase
MATDSTATESATPQSAATGRPTPTPPQRSSAGFSLIDALAGAVLGLVLAVGLAAAGYWPAPGRYPAFTDLDRRVREVERRSDEFQSAYTVAMNTSQQINGLSTRLETADELLRADLTALQDDTIRAMANAYWVDERNIARVNARVESLVPDPAVAERVDADLAALRAELQTLRPDPAEAERVDAELAALRAGLEAQAPDPAEAERINAELTALRAELDTLRSAQADIMARFDALAAALAPTPVNAATLELNPLTSP